MELKQIWFVVLICHTYLKNLRIVFAYKTNNSTDDCLKFDPNQFSSSVDLTKMTCYFSSDIKSMECLDFNIVQYSWVSDKEEHNQKIVREIICVARFPIKIQVVFRKQNRNVLFNSTKVVYTKSATDITDNSSYLYKGHIYFGSTYAGETLVKYYLVQQQNHEENVIVLVPAFKTSNLLSELDQAAKTNDSVIVEDELIDLPCIAINSKYPEGVYKGIHTGSSRDAPDNLTSTYIPVDDKILKWDFARGYRLNVTAWTLNSKGNDSFIGHYFCRSRSGFRPIPYLIAKRFELIMSPDFITSVNTISIELHTFSTAQLDLKCRSDRPLDILHTFENSSNILIRNHTFANINRYQAEIFGRNLKIGTKGEITCQTDALNGANFSHTWDVVVQDLGSRRSNGFWLDRLGKEAFCHEGSSGMGISYTARLKNLACLSPQECNYLTDCLKDDYHCGGILKSGEPCDYLNCARITPHPTGMIQCGYDHPVIYFRAFDNRLYNHWKDVLLIDNVLQIRIKGEFNTKSGIELYTKGTFEFVCKFHRFLSEGDAHWLIIYKNGTFQSLLSETGFTGRNYTKSDFIEVANDIYIDSTEIVQIMCVVPSWDTDVWVNNSLIVHVRESRVPKVTSKNVNAAFTLGANHQTLKCDVDSYPPASIRFHRLNMTPEDLTSEGYTLSEEPGSLSLTFPEFKDELAGKYFCTASNIVGNNTESFTVIISKGQHGVLIGVGCVVGIFILILIAAFIRVNLNLRKAQGFIDKLSDEEIENFLKGIENTTDGERDEINPNAFPYDRSYDIEKERLRIETSTILGSGEFGVVYKGHLDETPVAIKSIKSAGSASHIRSLLSELKLLIYIGKHEAIVQLVGSYVNELKDGVLYVAMELCELGNLHNFLKKMRESQLKTNNYCNTLSPDSRYHNVTIKESPKNIELDPKLCFPKWCYEISKAMEFLQQKHVIHSDLATRNILLTSDRKVKLTDFGLSRKLYNYTEYVKKNSEPLPWRWMAIECLRDLTFSHESDVWSFGVVIWEIYSYGATPYPGMDYDASFLSLLESGLRNGKPKMSDESLYTDIMMKCWEANPKDRISFATVKNFLEKKLQTNEQKTIHYVNG